jgi:hypothetical protein
MRQVSVAVNVDVLLAMGRGKAAHLWMFALCYDACIVLQCGESVPGAQLV